MKFFEYFPQIIYNNTNARNITLKTQIIKDIIDKKDGFYPYVIKDGERPDTIAHDYYGSSEYFWIVLYSNNIIDPYYQWPLSYNDFISYLKKKYGTNIETLMSRIDHYEYTGIGGNTDELYGRKTWKMTPETYSNLSLSDKAGWTAVYTYDHENDMNEAKREIQLLDNDYLNQINSEMSRLMNE